MNADAQPAGADHIGRSCPYCRFSFKGGVTVVGCPSCKAVHHAECWAENGGCAVMACPAAPGATPAATSPAPTAPLPPPAPGAVPLPPPPAPPVASPRAPAPNAAELIEGAKAWLNTPVVATAALTALTATGCMLGAGLAVAIITPDSALVGRAGDGVFKETLRLTVATTMARYGSSGFHIVFLPLLFVLVPLAASAFGALRQSGRTAHLHVGSRLLAGAACGVPLAAIMLVVGLLAGDDGLGFAGVSIILFSLLWGGIGGLLGAARACGPGSLAVVGARIPATAARYLGFARLALRQLGLLLAISAFIGIAAWTVQVARGQESAKLGRSTVGALIENPLYAGEFAVGIASLGAMAQGQPLGEDGVVVATPLPFEDDGGFGSFAKPWRIFAFSDNYAVFVFVFLLILVVGLPLALAVYAGFVIAAAAGARTFGLGAAHGAMVGVTWAIALTLLRWIGDMRWLDGNSVFSAVLLTTAVAGALGGLLAVRRAGGVPLPATSAAT